MDGTLGLVDGKRIVIDDPQSLPIALRLQSALVKAGLHWAIVVSNLALKDDEIGARLTIDRSLSSESYQLNIDRFIRITGGTHAGVFYGTCTLIQLLEQMDGTLPRLYIDDFPAFPVRGVMLDISRDKVPTMETLYHLVDMLASWKINQIQLYTEHTFAYVRHAVVWEFASPMSGQEIIELDQFCRERYIDLVPNQNSFGHMHRWLQHDAYRYMGETPDVDELELARGWVIPSPFSLSPAIADSLPFVDSLFDELLPHFTSRLFNVGCDETFDLGLGQSKYLVETQGKGRVYLTFLREILKAAQKRNVTPMFWADLVVEHPELVPELPHDVIALVYGYDADHPFDEQARRCAEANIPFYVCPGTSTWLSLFGRVPTSIGNIRNAAMSGLARGAIGLLNTDWGDNGHHQFLFASYSGFAYSAALGWNTSTEPDLSAALDLFAFNDRSGKTGQLMIDAGSAYLIPDDLPHLLGAPMVAALYRPLDELRESSWFGKANQERGFSLEELRYAMETIQSMRVSAQLPDPHIADEFEWSKRLWLHGAERLCLAVGDSSAKSAAAMVQDMRDLLDQYPSLWLRRNRQGGLTDSMAKLEKLIGEYSSLS